MEKQTDIRELAARLKALGVILKICREMNDAADFSAAAAIAANSPEVLRKKFFPVPSNNESGFSAAVNHWLANLL